MIGQGAGISRRGFLGVGGVFLAPAAGLRTTATARAVPRDFTTRATFDALDRGYNNGNGVKDQLNENRGALAWSEAYVLQSYVMMLEAYKDTYYADKLVDHIDHVLATRDSVRRVSAYPGRSMPVWRSTSPYNVGEVVLPGAEGRAVLRLRTAAGSAESISVTVVHPDAHTFELTVAREAAASARQADPSADPVQALSAEPQNRYTGLDLDSDGGRYAVQRINDAFATSTLRITAQAVSGSPRNGRPREGKYRFTSLPYVHAVHTGMIVYPMARFARLALRNRYLTRYRTKARGYLTAVHSALRAHDHELRNHPSSGRSWYSAPKGSPVTLDGSDLPLNYTAVMARAWRELALATGNRAGQERARALTRSFTRDVRTGDEGLVWSYYRRDGRTYQGWKPADGISQHWPSYPGATFVEDVSHGHLEVDLVARAHQLADLEDTAVLAGLASTFTAQLTGSTDDDLPLVHARVDGTGTAPKAQAGMVAGWLGLAALDRSIVTFVQDLYAQLDPAPSAQSVYGSAYLNWCARML